MTIKKKCKHCGKEFETKCLSDPICQDCKARVFVEVVDRCPELREAFKDLVAKMFEPDGLWDKLLQFVTMASRAIEKHREEYLNVETKDTLPNKGETE